MYAKQGNFIRVWDINRDEHKRTKEKETGMNDNGLGGGRVWGEGGVQRRGNRREEWEPRVGKINSHIASSVLFADKEMAR